jgi:hypothetical protein
MTQTQLLDHIENPPWVLEPPDGEDVPPPVETRDQLLPFEKLRWENFERLCLKLASLEGDAEFWRLYGTAGQEQGGIDIYVRRKSTTKYAAWQSKRHQSFNPAKIESAVKDFLSGKWADKSDRFVLCVQASLRSTGTADKIEECSALLYEKGIDFQPMDGEQLSQKLKSLPEIVNDFFGLSWVIRFCGQEAADALSTRLKPSEFHRLRGRLLACYVSHFSSVDPGVLSQMSTPTGGKKQLQLSERFVEPDLALKSNILLREVPPIQQAPRPQVDPASGDVPSTQPIPRSENQTRQETTRISLGTWVSDSSHDIVLGNAGAGKSAVLRYIALDMLSETPSLIQLRRRHPGFLPVWVSFAFWTKLIASGKDRSSLIDAIEAWFRRQDEAGLVELVRKAFEDKRLLLLVDGIDEWDNETAANTAIALLHAYAERYAIPVIMTGRPHGFRLITGLDGSWRISEIAPFTIDQQIDLAKTWFSHLNSCEEDVARSVIKVHHQAVAFISELQRNGPMAQLAATPLLLTGLIALKLAQLELPRNRFLAYAALTKLLLEIHPIARDKAALAGAPRLNLDPSTREVALAALAYAIHSGFEGTSPDSIEIDRAIGIVSQCLMERVGMSSADALQNARSILSLGEEEIGILVKKSPREVGFFHRVFQEFLSSQHLASMEFSSQIELIRTHAADVRWRDVILCLLHQLHRPNEVDRLLAVIEDVQGDLATIASRDILLAEAAFGDFRKSPQLASKLADRVFQQIELGRWPSVRGTLVAQAIEGLSSPVLGPKVSKKLRQWFPRWHSYGLVRVYQAISDWPDDSSIEPILWRGLHDEFYGAVQATARTIGKRLGGQRDAGELLCKMISAPASLSAAAGAIEALWRGWPQLPQLNDILTAANHSESPLIAIAAIRGRVALSKHDDGDFSFLTQLGERDEYALDSLIEEALLAGWAGDERLRAYALATSGEYRRFARRRGPDLGLLINGFPGDAAVAALVASDLAHEHPSCLFEKDDLRSLATNFKNNPIIVAALESWLTKHREEDAYTISFAARVAPTSTFKAALLKCIEGDHLSFWAASALVNLWGSDDEQVRSALIKSSTLPVKKRQNVAHVLPFVISDKAHCRQLLLEIVGARDRIRADFALEGLRHLGVDASDQDATDCALARGYDDERFILENEAREVILTFKNDERVMELAKRQLKREFGAIGTVALVFSDNAEMRKLVLEAIAPLDLNMRSNLLDSLSSRAGYDADSRSLISTAQLEESGDIIVGASIKLARANKETDQVNEKYLAGIQHELDAIGPRMDARRQGAVAALTIIRRLDLLAGLDSTSVLRGLGVHEHREMLRLVATEWGAIVESLGGESAALAALGVERKDFFDVFSNDLEASKAIRMFALGLIDGTTNDGAPAAAIRLVERARPGSGFLRELCVRSLRFNGRSNWDSFATALTAGEVLGRNFAADSDIEKHLLENLNVDPRDAGSIAALCEGWPTSGAFDALRVRLQDNPDLPVPVVFKLMSVASTPERLVDGLVWAANELEGGLWEGIPYWVSPVVRRLKDDDTAYARTRDMLFDRPSPGMKASFPRILSRARGLSEELRVWCQAECKRADADLVGEVGFDIIAGQARLVVHSIFDLLNGRDI